MDDVREVIALPIAGGVSRCWPIRMSTPHRPSRPQANTARDPARRRIQARRWLLGAFLVAVVVTSFLCWPRLRYGEPVEAPDWAAGIRKGRLDSEYCISCHKEAGQNWMGSTHRMANRPVDRFHPAAWFNGHEASTHAADYKFLLDEHPLPLIQERRRDGSVLEHRPSMAIAHSTLRQFLVETKPGTFQTTEVAWDPAKQEWFGTFGMEERNPGEWGHWTGQSMNWNSMCARCHMTVYEKRYDEATDSYRSTWVEHGVGCVQCHGPMTGHEPGGAAFKRVANISRDPQHMIQTCAPCHARAEDLTRSFPPGELFEDHFRLQLMTDPRYYYADGQILDEDFEWGSFRHSKMAAAGVTCLDCHNAHTGKLKLPAENNSLCMQCHLPDNQRKAPVIDPTAHSFHKPESTGNRCVECHMAETTYMQRDPRRDHGFITPDPLLNRELGIPDACTKCHKDKGVEWNIEAWEKWYGPSGKAAPRRARTRAVQRAYDGDVAVVPELLRLIGEEKTPGWRASLLGLAAQLAPGNESVIAVARAMRADADPMIRATAVRALAEHEPSRALVREALKDPVRLVRLDAAWALSTELPAGSSSRRELDEYLDVFSDSPIALLRRGQDRFRLGRQAEGIADVRRAIALDSLSAPIPEALGFMLNATNRPRDAAEQFEKAAELAPQDAVLPYYAALAWAEAGVLSRTEAMLREAVRRDPAYARAWYNLGLVLNQAGRVDEALAALASAEKAGPRDPDIPFAAATIYAQRNRLPEAEAAARRALAIAPDHPQARALLQQLRR
jgi:predicted CXXCH cytochrome family protein